jgi:hypothetical protein
MKKSYLFFKGLLLVVLMTSCSSEEALVKENTTAFEISKTPEMQGFDAALKTYLRAKKENAGNKSNLKEEDTKLMKEKTILLLNSIGKSELAAQETMDTDQLMLLALREYSKKLTEMRKQQNSNHK